MLYLNPSFSFSFTISRELGKVQSSSCGDTDGAAAPPSLIPKARPVVDRVGGGRSGRGAPVFHLARSAAGVDRPQLRRPEQLRCPGARPAAGRRDALRRRAFSTGRGSSSLFAAAAAVSAAPAAAAADAAGSMPAAAAASRPALFYFYYYRRQCTRVCGWLNGGFHLPSC